uniref:TFIID subunit TAF5 NTD2 domain-containing protein n=1 Tax=Kalanchoe fedtschenkoi TaxID=63787 RepID=A0A7N0R8E8_KALFE
MMGDEELEKVVVGYLKRKGLKLTERTLMEENKNSTVMSENSHREASLSSQILAFPEYENIPVKYHDGYSRLRSWAYGSLDVYKHELLRVLYPVYIHSFMDLVAKGYIQEARTFFSTFREDHEMMHMRDLQKLEAVISPSHLEEMEFAHTLRQSKVKIKICQYSYDMLLQYLHKTESITILGIINEHINFQVSPGQPGSISDDADSVTVIGSNQDAVNQINQKEILWGLLEDSLEERLEKGGLLSDSEKADGDTKEADLEENKRKSADGGKQTQTTKKLKKDKVTSTAVKAARPETATVTAPRVKPELALPAIPTEVEQSILEDLRNRVQLSSAALPSVSFYTFLNAHNALNCAAISADGSMVAGGFADSSLKVWDMAKLGQQASKSALHVLQGEDNANESTAGSKACKRNYTQFLGHSGPVYSATFSPMGDFILSSSADSTIRLWSTKLNANLVCYKGHNYPVWDVQFSPVGHYFASSSHDRTARIWSMDRIQPLRILAGHLSDVDCVRWHENCNYVATGSSDKTVKLWDVQSGECVRIFVGHRSMILSLAMSPDGRYMASGDEDGTINMWDLASGRCVTPLLGHTSCVWSLAFSCEGALLASGSADCSVKLWDVSASAKVSRNEEKNGASNRLRSLKTLPTKSTPVYSLQFSRRNLLFAAGVLSV